MVSNKFTLLFKSIVKPCFLQCVSDNNRTGLLNIAASIPTVDV